jgi:hypothetical protein
MGKRDYEERAYRLATPLAAIRAMCVRCFGYEPHSVATCTDKECPLWPWRFGNRKQAKIQIKNLLPSNPD